MTPNNGSCDADVCSNPSYGSSICNSTKKATWIEGNCTDALGVLVGHTQAACTGPLIWEVSGTCSDITFTTKSTCEVGNTWTSTPTCSDSFYPDEASCTAFVGVKLPACDDGVSGTKVDCEAVPAIWLTASEFNCKKGGGGWSSIPQEICLKIDYGSDTAYSKIASTNPAVVNENGLIQALSFSSFKKLSDNSVITSIPQGYYDLGIYKYAGTNCTVDSYPSDKNRYIYFFPNAIVPTINW